MRSPDRRRTVRINGVAVRVRRGRLARHLGWLCAGFGLAAAGMAAIRVVVPGAMASGCALLAVVESLAWGFWALSAWQGDGGTGSLELTETGVSVDRDGQWVVIPWSQVARWRMQPQGDCEAVQFEQADGDAVTAVLTTEEQSAAVLAAARTAEARRTMEVTLAPSPRTWREVALVLAAVVAAVGMNSELDAAGSARLGLVCTLAALAGLAWLVRLRDVARVVVGTDGVALARGGSLRFVPYGAVLEVDWDELGVLLRLHDGEVVALPVVSPQGLRDARDATVARLLARRDALHERVRAELSQWRMRPAPATGEHAGVALLDRHGRSLTAWRAGLRALVSGTGAGYRQVALDREDVVRIVEDPRAPVERRVAAALALAPEHDPGLRARVRAVADACALEPVRVAIDRAVAGDLDEATLAYALTAAGQRPAG